MQITELKKKIEEFDKKAGWDKTEFDEFTAFIQEELNNLKSSKGDKQKINHLLTDILVLIMQMGYRHDIEFNSEIEKWFDKSKKYIK